MTTPNHYRDLLQTLLTVDELARVDALIASTPPAGVFASWLPERGMVLVGCKLDGELGGWLLVPAADEFEARALGEHLANGLARSYGPLREARRASAAAIRKASH